MISRARLFLFALFCIFIMLFSQASVAQDRRPTRTTAVLEIHLVYSDENSAGENILVEVEQASGGIVARSFTNSMGQVSFGLPAANYIVHVRAGKVKEISSRMLDLNMFDRKEYIHVVPNDPPKNESEIPEKARKQFDQGKDSMAKGEDKAAIEYFQKALELYPQYASAYNNMGTIYMKSNDRVHAREAWTKALTTNPNLDSANANLARLDLMENKFADALPLLEKVLAVQPQNAQMLMFMCQAQLMTDHFDQALIYVKKLHAVDHHQYMLAHLYAGRIHEAQKHPDLAREEYETLLKEAPDSPEADEARKSIERLDNQSKKQ